MYPTRRRLIQSAASLGSAMLGVPRLLHAAAPERVVISVPGPGNLLFLPITLASRLGLDKEAGLELDIRYVSGGPLAYRAMIERNSDFSAGGLPALALQKINGNPVVCIAPLTRVPAYTLLVRSGLKGRVKQIADLSGKVVGIKGYSPGGRSTSQLFTEFVLQKAGVGSEKVNFVSVGQTYENQNAALVTGTVDAIMGDEPFASRIAKDKEGFVLADYHDLPTTRKQLGGLFLNGQIATREDMVSSRPQTVEKMVKMMQSTLQWIGRHSGKEMADALLIGDAEERNALLEVLKLRKGVYAPDVRFSQEQIACVERFIRATENTAAAQAFALKSIIQPRWAGSMA